MSSYLGWTIDKWRDVQLSSSPADRLSHILDLCHSFSQNDPAWISIASDEQVSAQLQALSDLSNTDALPLFGVPFAVKDNIDAASFSTTAACPAYAYSPNVDSSVVAALRAAGAIVVGKTNLDQFATGLVGTRSPYGITPCAFSDKHVSGGSSAGSASVVARGLVPFSLGTDTAGSGRVPAMLNNIIGIKPTRGLLSCSGVVPACKSLDCVSIFALNLSDARAVFSVAAKYDPSDPFSRQAPSDAALRIFPQTPLVAVVKDPLFFDDDQNPELYATAVENLRAAGAEVLPIDFSPLFKLAACLYEGPWVAERYAAIRDFITSATSKQDMDPTVYQIIKSAEKFSAADAFKFEYLRLSILREVEQFDKFDAMLVPTAPANPTIAAVQNEPVIINSRQGTYTNFVNLADYSALAIPAGFRPLDKLPFGVTLISKKFNDYALLELAQRYLTKSAPNRSIGAIDATVRNGDVLPSAPQPKNTIPLAVVGAHLTAMPLNYQLHEVMATLAQRTTTSHQYRLYSLPRASPPKPGLERVNEAKGEKGEAIDVEVWNIPVETFGLFFRNIPHPLALGSVELIDGTWVKGFVCEQIGYDNDKAIDITKHKSWRSYMTTITGMGTSKPPFRAVLVANRGEIAVRIIKTLKKLNIKSVAVYSDTDRYSQHVIMADHSIPLHGTTAAQTYLSSEKIIAAAKETHAEAIIPGYGFLSENANFADACIREGIVFVGPSGDIIRSLGLKHSAREIAKKANVPLVPGSAGLVQSVDDAVSNAKTIGYPLMVKSTAGGGGIGLQRVDNESELYKAYDTVRHQAQSYFSDPGIFLERFVDNARHVEIQIFGDGKGKAVSLGERDCSLQRRNQKIIEETPAPRLSEQTRQAMRAAAERLASLVKYSCAGTVEFIYDEERDEFYFLEVNTRLQVEHPITEMVTGLDLVEWMLQIAAGTTPSKFETPIIPQGAAMEARIYAENPVKDFLPSPGQLTNVEFPKDARVDTWVSKGTVISAEYDPTIAKVIVHGRDREDALKKLCNALDATSISGVVTNLDYVRSIAASSMFENAQVATRVLDSYPYRPNAIEVISPGSHTSIQDYPGRKLLWHIGVPPSGPMDDYSFRIANRLVGNDPSAPAIECTLVGPSLLFHSEATIAVTGGACPVYLDSTVIDLWKATTVKPGQKLTLGKLTTGCRAYIAVRNGIDVPEYLGSRSTFTLGKFGGHNGRVLKFGDLLMVGRPDLVSCTLKSPIFEPTKTQITSSLLPHFTQPPKPWKIGVTVGPHGAPDFFTIEDILTFFQSEWKVHYNSNRFGVRLIGPKPKWARPDGGEAGLHPSNAHDYVYAPGAVNFTGDEPVLLTNDGPSLGGFVCPAVVVESERWKLGQLKPGDRLSFVPITAEEAVKLNTIKNTQIESLSNDGQSLQDKLDMVVKSSGEIALSSPILAERPAANRFPKIVYRQSGDRYILIEYGENYMDLNLSYLVHRIIDRVKQSKTPGVVEMSRGVRSVLVEFETMGEQAITQKEILQILESFNNEVSVVDENWHVPSRVFRLPMAFEDKETLASVERYKDTIRSNAPWLPNNVDFLTKINSLPSRESVHDILYSARFLVLGLGDVFLGAPCAVPLDPRHRLLGTKYNPSRSFTPNGTVGIGGMYMCIYTSESPGGYQLVGRTIPIWDKLTVSPHTSTINGGRPWLLSPFDQIEFYPVTEGELDKLVAEVENGYYDIDVESGDDVFFDHGEYSKWLKANETAINEFRSEHQNKSEATFAQLMKKSDLELERQRANDESTDQLVMPDNFSDKAVFIYGEVAGRMWKTLVAVGDIISKDMGLVIVEAMKTEMVVNSTIHGKVVKLMHKHGDFLDAGDLIAVVEPVSS